MQCSQIRGMLSNYALGDTRVTERICVEAHIARCRACQRELEDLCEIINACEQRLSHPAPRDDFEGLMLRVAANEAAYRETPLRVRLRWGALAVRATAAAAVVLVLVFSAPLLRQTGRAVREVREITAEQAGSAARPGRVPAFTQSFVNRASTIERGEIADLSQFRAPAAAVR